MAKHFMMQQDKCSEYAPYMALCLAIVDEKCFSPEKAYKKLGYEFESDVELVDAIIMAKLNQKGYSWSAIGKYFYITRSAAHHKVGRYIKKGLIAC